MTNVLVVGAGFLGIPLARTLDSLGHAVRVLDHKPRPATVQEGVDWIQGDVVQPADVQKALVGMDAVIHLAWSTVPATSNARPQEDVRTNLLGSLVLMQAAADAGARRFVFASSGGTVYGITPPQPISEAAPTDPISSYGAVKLAVEKYLGIFAREQGLDPCILRFANVYGPGQRLDRPQGAVAWFLRSALAGQPVTIWGDGTIVRDYVYVDDAVQALAQAVRRAGTAHAQRVFNVGTGRGTSLLELCSLIEQQVGRPLRRELKPARGLDVPYNVLDCTRAAHDLDWRARVSLEDGLKATVEALATA